MRDLSRSARWIIQAHESDRLACTISDIITRESDYNTFHRYCAMRFAAYPIAQKGLAQNAKERD